MSTASATTPLRTQVLSAYKALLRAQKKTFGQDMFQIRSARQYTRDQFLKSAKETDPAAITKLVTTANQAATIIRRNVVQGVRKREDTFQLRLDEEKEINDNESIRSRKGQPPQRAGTAPVKCCSA
ncbi:uncharacterized protein EV422DRAFT_537290 [Fimicolochytrium jonesii]|uniref:uncharacterized protein n=1 Tax=Fimicolochytrium jonesii TaxID=1396493 RepID=UPI0022FE7F32|nr:uncharacterized protein EV422DRAFT_537290 [Fimicolochytrium jonesii]KAI8818503.1 hypothetical protein EV422DRAFT_537290 [Fimicolochytrium jonesii]